MACSSIPHQIVTLPREAPDKPAFGAPCNGCGICCAAELCPVGRIVFRRRRGPCPALTWQAPERRHVCGLAAGPFAPLVRRWISAGTGCDSTATVETHP